MSDIPTTRDAVVCPDPYHDTPKEASCGGNLTTSTSDGSKRTPTTEPKPKPSTESRRTPTTAPCGRSTDAASADVAGCTENSADPIPPEVEAALADTHPSKWLHGSPKRAVEAHAFLRAHITAAAEREAEQRGVIEGLESSTQFAALTALTAALATSETAREALVSLAGEYVDVVQTMWACVEQDTVSSGTFADYNRLTDALVAKLDTETEGR